MDAHYNFRILRACLRPLVFNNLQLFSLCEHLLHKYPLSFPKIQSICLAVSSESEHDRRMIAIAFIFVHGCIDQPPLSGSRWNVGTSAQADGGAATSQALGAPAMRTQQRCRSARSSGVVPIGDRGRSASAASRDMNAPSRADNPSSFLLGM